MFSKVLVANRGECAVRIIRACKELGLSTVAIYSKVDSISPHVLLADECVCIGKDTPKSSYLNSINILSAAKLKGADAIHPGIGFFAEDDCFAKLCGECGITFIGADPSALEIMGDKMSAKQFVSKLNIPVVPGTLDTISNISDAERIAKEIGYPVIIKAVGGGGGKGIRVVRSPEEFTHMFTQCEKEAENAFRNKGLIIEMFLQAARHVEVQIMADRFGNVVHLGERECSVQSGKQKFIEEAPCDFIPVPVKHKLYRDAMEIARAVGYVGVGTVEFLVTPDEQYYFMEMNTRLQVEHTITEMISGIDIVIEQIRIHSGEGLSVKQDDVCLSGHSIECRICLSSKNKGKHINFDMLPGGFDVRMECGIMNGSTVTWYYDPLLLKVIVKARDRVDAIKKMKAALDEVIFIGIMTNLDAHKTTLNDACFLEGRYNINDFEHRFKI